MESARATEWVIRRLYRLELEDCCVAGSFTARLSGLEWGYDDEPGHEDVLTALVFDNGVRLTTWAQVRVEVVPD